MLELKNISKKYGNNTVVNDISLVIKAGEFFSLLGPSGCGKTTLLRLIAGFEKPTIGSILLKGNSIDSLPPYKRDVNTVFQNYALFPNYSVFDNIAYGLRIKKIKANIVNDKVNNIMKIVGLEGFQERMPSQLSGGQQQRVTLARALVNEPSILLLDEPLSALDKKISETMRIELIEIQKKVGITFIYVTHNQAEALTMSNRIAVMNKGVIDQCGTPEEIYENPSTYFVSDFIGSMNFFDGHIVEVGNDKTVVKLSDGTIIKRIGKIDTAVGKKILYGIRPHQLKISLLEPREYENGLTGIIQHRIYIGEITKFYIRINEKMLLEVVFPNYLISEANMILPEEGEKVNIVWSQTSGNILNEKT